VAIFDRLKGVKLYLDRLFLAGVAAGLLESSLPSTAYPSLSYTLTIVIDLVRASLNKNERRD
jgi:hypothetical protein